MANGLREVATAGGLLTEEFPNPDGSPATYVWVVLNRESAAARAAGQDAPIKFQLVKGHVEPGEAPTDTAVREVREELGLIAIAGSKPAGMIKRKAWEYDLNGHRSEEVIKVITMYAMEQDSAERAANLDEQPELVRVDQELLGSMHYPEEAEFLAQYFDIEPPVRQ